MTESILYGIWNEKREYWVHINNDLGLFTVNLSIARGMLVNIERNLGKGWENVDYRICRLGRDGLPAGELPEGEPTRETESALYGIWNVKQGYWTHLNNNLGLFAGGDIGLRLIHGFFHDIRQKYDHCWEEGSYQIYRLGNDGQPTGELLND